MVLKMEVGRVYTDGKTKVRCIALLDYKENGAWQSVCVPLQGKEYNYGGKTAYGMIKPFLVDTNGDTSDSSTYGSCPKGLGRLREYKEPVVHKRDIVWLQSPNGKPQPVLISEGSSTEYFVARVIKRETVECVEDDSET